MLEFGSMNRFGAGWKVSGDRRALRAVTLSFITALILVPIANVTGFQTGDIEFGTPFSQEEYQALPRYCWASNAINNRLTEPLLSAQERRQWYDYMGKDFMHIHHWCWGLMEVRRGNQARDPRIRASNYRAAIRDFDYVIGNCSSSFRLKPEFHLRKALTLRLMGDDGRAAAEFSRAIELKADYTPAYSGLVDLHLDLGNAKEARRILEVGLQEAPDSQLLARKKAELDVGSARDEP